MILVGNQRGHGRDLALHLLNARDNEHVTLHDLRGYVADDLVGAFAEAEAISLGTKCRQYLFSLSLNPPPGETVPVEVFETAIAEIERALGLTDQPRAIVFHEKHGRRHAHCVWSRIDAARMRGINLPHYKRRLQRLAREFYRRHGWEMPAGFTEAAMRDPLAFGQIEAAQAKCAGRDPKALKAAFQACWAQSDSLSAFRAALLSEGFVLAQGARRAFVAVDAAGNVYSLSRWTGAGAKALRDRLGLPDGLPSIESARRQIGPPEPRPEAKLDAELADLVARQRTERAGFEATQQVDRTRSRAARHARLPTGLKAAWARLTGRHATLVAELARETEAERKAQRRDLDRLIGRHLAERRALQRSRDQQAALEALADTAQIVPRDPRQRLVLPEDDPLPSAAALELRPDALLDHLSAKSETFTLGGIDAVLRKVLDDPAWCARLRERLMRSPELVPQSSDGAPRFTTRSYLAAQDHLLRTADVLAHDRSFAVDAVHVEQAMRTTNTQLAAHGASLSDEQAQALHHVTTAAGLSCLVGTAGAGKSTLLEAARLAWEAEGLRVHGAALAGKAADGLEQASGIPSRTLAALEHAWKGGRDPIAPGSVVVIDEVGMVGTRQLSRVLARLTELRCKVVLVGDPEQLQPIEAGTPFRDLLARHEHAALREVRRQRADWQRAASISLSQGNAANAIAAYEARNHVTRTRSTDAAISALVDDYIAAESASPAASRLALAHRRRDVFALNQAIRLRRVASGALQTDTLAQTDHGPRAFAAGDRVLFTRNDAALGLRNGMLGTIRAIDGPHLEITLDDTARRITVDTNTYRALDHGYAVSIHKSQGCTVDQTFVLGSRSMGKHLTYVAMTRHRDEMRLYAETVFGLKQDNARVSSLTRKHRYFKQTM